MTIYKIVRIISREEEGRTCVEYQETGELLRSKAEAETRAEELKKNDGCEYSVQEAIG